MSAHRRRLRPSNVLPALAPLAAVALAVTLLTSNFAEADAEPRAIATSSGPSSSPARTTAPPAGVPAATRTLTAYGNTPTAAAACVVTFVVSNEWDGGFQADVTIANPGRAWKGWTLSWPAPAGLTITTIWNGVAQPAGSGTTVSNVAWNADVAPGSSVSFGFTASGPVWTPTRALLNGAACTVHVP